MSWPVRFRVRTLMALVALVALGFGIAFDLRYRAERDRLLKIPAERWRQAAIHMRRIQDCEYQIRRGKPYSRAERAALLSRDRLISVPRGGVGYESWQAELQDHQYWGPRFHGMAEDVEGRVKALEAKLLFP